MAKEKVTRRQKSIPRIIKEKRINIKNKLLSPFLRRKRNS